MEEMAAKKKAAADLRKSLEEYKRSGRFTVPDRVNHIRKLQKVDGVEIYAVQYTTIQRAAQTSDVAGIRYFVAKGMLNDADEMGNTALHEGARFGYQNIVRELCAQGCDVNTRNNIGQTPAHLATAGGHGDLLELIYDKGGDLTLPDAGGSTCAHYAAQVNRVDILETLYRLQDFPLGPEVLSIASKNGITPAHIAAGFDCLEALDFLYRHGCALDPRDVTGEMPCHKAARGGHNRTLRGLKKINMDFGVANVDEDSTNDIVDDKSRFWKEGGGESMKSLRELAKMRRDGKLSHREFQRMKMAELDQPGAGLNMAAEQESMTKAEVLVGLASTADYYEHNYFNPHSPLMTSLSHRLRGSKDVVLKLLEVDKGRGLSLATLKLRSDPEVCLTAAKFYQLPKYRYHYGANMGIRHPVREFGPSLLGDKGFIVQVLDLADSALATADVAVADAREIRRDRGEEWTEFEKNYALLIELMAGDESSVYECYPDFMEEYEMATDAYENAKNELISARSRQDEATLSKQLYCQEIAKHMARKLGGDRGLVLRLCGGSGRALEHAQKKLQNDKQVVLAAVACEGEAFTFASKKLQKDRAVVFAALAKDPHVLRAVPRPLDEDRAVLAVALRSSIAQILTPDNDPDNDPHDPFDGYGDGHYDDDCVFSFLDEFAHVEALVGDRDLMLEACAACPDVFEFLLPPLKEDREIAELVVSKRGHNLMFCSPLLRADEELVLAAVRNSGRALEHAAAELQGAPPVVLAAVQQNGEALMFASEAMQSDEAVVSAAVAQTSAAYRYATPAAQALRGIVLAAVKGSHFVLDAVPEALLSDREVMLAAMEKNATAITFCPPLLRGDKDIGLAAVKSNGMNLAKLTPALRADEDVVVKAVAATGRALQYAHVELRRTRRVLLAACASDGLALCCAAREEDFESFAEDLAEALRSREHFVSLFLPATLEQPQLQKRRRSRRHMCHLPALFARDEETATALKKLIAEFAGVPIGKENQWQMEGAVANLEMLCSYELMDFREIFLSKVDAPPEGEVDVNVDVFDLMYSSDELSDY